MTSFKFSKTADGIDRQIPSSNNKELNLLRNSAGAYQLASQAGGITSAVQSQGSDPQIIEADTTVFSGTSTSSNVASTADGNVQFASTIGFQEDSARVYDGLNDLNEEGINFGEKSYENEEKIRNFMKELDPNSGVNREMDEWEITTLSGWSSETAYVASGITQGQAGRTEGIIITGAGETAGHNIGSGHYGGLGIDIRNNDAGDAVYNEWKSDGLTTDAFEQKYGFPKEAIRIKDERTRPLGQTTWTGAHYDIKVDSNVMQEYIETHSTQKPFLIASSN